MESANLATELLHEVKASARRWFYIAIAELIVIAVLVCMICFVPSEEVSTTVEQEAHDAENTTLIGGDYNGETEDNKDLQKTQDGGQKAP